MNRFFSPFNPFDAAAGLANRYLGAPDDPTNAPDWVQSLIGGNWRRFLGASIPGWTHVPQQADYENTLFHPSTPRYSFSTRGRQEHPEPGPVSPWRIELARMDVPRGYVGIVRSFEQYLASFTLAGTWAQVDAGGHDPFADIDAGVSGTWFFRLSTFEGEQLAWLNQLNPVPERPGIPYPDLVETASLWFPAGNDNTVRLVVPSGYTLRVFWECAALQNRPAVAAAIKGQVQGLYSSASLNNSRGMW